MNSYDGDDPIPLNFKVGCLVRLLPGVGPLNLKPNQIYKVESITSSDKYRFKIFGLDKTNYYSPAFEVIPEDLSSLSIPEVKQALDLLDI